MHKPTMRVLQVLELLCASDQPLRLAQISRALEVPKSTLLPILQTMLQCRYIARDESDRYFPGLALLEAGAAAGAVYSPADDIKSCLKELVDTFAETCYFGVLEGNNVLYIEKADSPQPLRMLTAIGHRLPAYATGIGKALLMDKTKEELQRLYPDPLQPLTGNTVQDLDALYAQLQQAKKDGYAWEVEESTDHIRCFAVPVRKNGKITGAISIAIPVFRFQEESRASIVEALKKTAARLGKTLQLT